MKPEYKQIFKSIKYVSSLQQGGVPGSDGDPLLCLKDLLNGIISASSRKQADKVVINIEDAGKNLDVNILEDCSYVLHHLFPKLILTQDDKQLAEYLRVTSQFLDSNNVSLKSKISLVNYENLHYKSELDCYFSKVFNSKEPIKSRIKLCVAALKSEFLDSDDKKNAQNILKSYIAKMIDNYVDKGQIIQADDFLRELLLQEESSLARAVFIQSLVFHNTFFNLSSKNELQLLIDEYQEDLEPEDLNNLKGNIDSNPGDLELKSFSIGKSHLKVKDIERKKIYTFIRFSIPMKCLSNSEQEVYIDEKVRVLLSPIKSLWLDPIFKMMRSWKIANMGWNHFCDVDTRENEGHTHVQILIKDLYVPELTLAGDKFIEKKFEEESALLGRTYYPHKEFVVKLLLDNYLSLRNYLLLEKADININLFSNYIVKAVDVNSEEMVYQKLFALTNPNSYLQTLAKFMEKFNSANLSDAFVDVRSLLISTKIESEKTLKDFVLRCIDVFVKHCIEQHRGYEYLWKNGTDGVLVPCKEIESQPYIFTLLRSVFDFMGIQISKEVESSNGEIDFLLSFTNSQNKILRLCIELKLAHAKNVENGFTHQLPAYLKGERCNYGIYIVLWYKCRAFEKPQKYRSVKELDDRFKSINTNKKISHLIINCTKPVSPSKLK